MKFVCSVCGYVYEGDTVPAECPVCHAGSDKFVAQSDERTWAAEHVVGVAKGVSEDILSDLRANFNGECSEVGMYLAMARVAHRVQNIIRKMAICDALTAENAAQMRSIGQVELAYQETLF